VPTRSFERAAHGACWPTQMWIAAALPGKPDQMSPNRAADPSFHHVAVTWWKELLRWCSATPTVELNHTSRATGQWRSPAPPVEPTEANIQLGLSSQSSVPTVSEILALGASAAETCLGWPFGLAPNAGRVSCGAWAQRAVRPTAPRPGTSRRCQKFSSDPVRTGRRSARVDSEEC